MHNIQMAPPSDEMENKDEACYWREMNLQDVGLEFDAGEERSPGENVESILTKLNL